MNHIMQVLRIFIFFLIKNKPITPIYIEPTIMGTHIVFSHVAIAHMRNMPSILENNT